MSYCVNCGVELDESAKKCALCSTPVINPNVVVKEETKPFSDKLQIPKSMQRKFIAYIITMILLIPNIVLFFVNVFFVRGQFWSVYVFATSFLLWVLTVFPFFTKKSKPYLLLTVDTAAILAFAYIVCVLGIKNFLVFKCVFAVVLVSALLAFILTFWLRKKKRHWTAVVIHVLIDSILISLFSGGLVGVIVNNVNFFIVGIIIALCSLALLGYFIYCNRSRHMRVWLNKFFYV